MSQILANLFALIASLSLAYSTRKKTKQKILPIIIISDICFIVANLLIGTYPAVIINIISLLRNFLASKKRLSKSTGLILTLIGIIVAIIMNTYQFLIILPILASTIYAFALVFTKKPQSIRIALFFNMSLWSIHDLLVGLYTSSFVNFISVIMILLNILKYRKH